MTQPSDDALHWERRARMLLQSVAVATAEPRAPEEVLQLVLDEVCRGTGWPVGHALVAGPDGALVSARIWHLGDTRFAPFRAASEAAAFQQGVGMPGRVLQTGRPLWIMDVVRDSNFPRARLASELGLHAGLSFPVNVHGKVQAVLEFFATAAVEPDQPLLEVLETIGAQLGRVYERRLSEEAVRESEQRLRAVAETAHDAIITADSRGLIVTWNRAAEGMFGWSEEEIRGKPLTVIIPGRYRQEHEQGMARVQSGGERHVIGRTAVLEGIHKNGSEIPLELSLATWTLGGLSFYTGILRDIRERKANERRLEKLARELADSERRATLANRAKSVFLANMSHELRTPLNAILGFVQLVARDAALSAEQRDNLDIILRSGEHLLSLINDVLSLSKIEAGSLELRVLPFRPQRLLEGVGEMFRLRAQARGLALEVSPARGWPARVRGDEGKLRQVLINLLGNAVKFTGKGKVKLEARWSAGRGSFVVEDTGPGIAPEDAALLFQPFAQAEPGRAAREGTGLGLAISREFVRCMGGDLTVESAPGQGARFAFELPLPEEAASAPEEVAERRVLSLAPGQPELRVLVVDDRPDGRLLLSRLLGGIGCAVRDAPDGPSAIAAWQAFAPALVWMDLRMPGMDGLAATRAIRALEAKDPSRPRCTIVALTASAFDESRPEIAAAGCDGILHKPFREADLFGLMARHLGTRFVHQEAPPALPAQEGGITPEALQALPAAELARLRSALEQGDDVRALAAVQELAGHDPRLALAAHGMVKAFQFDELLSLLERSAP